MQNLWGSRRVSTLIGIGRHLKQITDYIGGLRAFFGITDGILVECLWGKADESCYATAPVSLVSTARWC